MLPVYNILNNQILKNHLVILTIFLYILLFFFILERANRNFYDKKLVKIHFMISYLIIIICVFMMIFAIYYYIKGTHILLKLNPKDKVKIDDTTTLSLIESLKNDIKDIKLGINVQWNYNKDGIKIIEVDHLQGSTFLYRREAAAHGYEKKLSRVAHREETIFTYELFKKGYKLYVVPDAITWHLKSPNGGIRTTDQIELFNHDEEIFRSIIGLKEKTIVILDRKIIFLSKYFSYCICYRTHSAFTKTYRL